MGGYDYINRYQTWSECSNTLYTAEGEGLLSTVSCYFISLKYIHLHWFC